MERNMGSIDRTIRVITGLAIIAVGITNQSWWGAIGIIPLLTAAVGTCPAYLPFGLRTCAPRSSATRKA